MRNYKYAKIAYEAYCQARNWKSVNGEVLPHFNAQSPELQDAWWEAAEAVWREIRDQTSFG